MKRVNERVIKHWKVIGIAACVIAIGVSIWWYSLAPLERAVISLDYGTSSMRQAANWELGRLVMESDDPIPPLLEAFRRYRSTNSLLQFRNMLQVRGWEGPKAEPALRRLLDHDDSWIRECAVWLSLWHDERHDPFEFRPAELPILIRIVEQGEGSPTVLPAVEAIGRFGPDAEMAIPALIDGLQRGKSSRNFLFHRALEQIGPGGDLWKESDHAETAIPILIELLDREFYLLLRGGEGRYIFDNFDQASFYDAPVVLLTAIGEPAIHAVLESLNQGGFRSREKSANILGRIGPSAKVAVSALVTALQEDEHPRVRRAAAHALGRIGPDAKAALPALTEALNDNTPEEEFVDYFRWSMHPAPLSIPRIAKLAIGHIQGDDADSGPCDGHSGGSPTGH